MYVVKGFGDQMNSASEVYLHHRHHQSPINRQVGLQTILLRLPNNFVAFTSGKEKVTPFAGTFGVPLLSQAPYADNHARPSVLSAIAAHGLGFGLSRTGVLPCKYSGRTVGFSYSPA